MYLEGFITMTQTSAVSFHPPAAAITLPVAATWPLLDVLALFDLPFNDLMFKPRELPGRRRGTGNAAVD
jgi:biotin synthase